MNHQATAAAYMNDSCEMEGPVKSLGITPCEGALSAVESETNRLCATIQALRSRLEPVLRSEPDTEKCGHARERGQSPIHERLLCQQGQIESATRLLELIESLLTI